MKQGSDEQKLVAAARNAAITMDRANPARQIIFDLVNAFEKLHRTHDLCHISKPVNVAPVSAPASCDCKNKMGNIKLCRDHAIDRLTFLGNKLQPLYATVTPLASERDEIRDAMAHDIKVTKIPAVGHAADGKPARPMDPNKVKAYNILLDLPGTVVKK